MSIDLLCGECQGHLLAEEPGSVVACPHCGAHLQVPGLDDQEVPTSEADSTAASPPDEMPDRELVGAASESITNSIPGISTGPTSVEVVASELNESITAADEEFTPLSDLPSHSSPRMTPAAPALAATAATPTLRPVIQNSGPNTAATVPRFWFLMALSYASAVTLAFLFLLLTLGRIKTHPLESLPDVVPKIQNGEVALEVAPPDADVPRGHVLPIGESRRYGSLKVSPLRITQGSLKFEHLLNDPTAVRPASSPVFKLWLKFENVSHDQTFTPLDSLLLFKRHYQNFSRAALTNQFLCQADQRKPTGDLRYLFEISSNSEFRIAGQNLNTVLAPGATVEMFIPSEERIDNLTGDLVWRVQFRKGYHSRTRHGVTTLIDIPFQFQDVQSEM